LHCPEIRPESPSPACYTVAVPLRRPARPTALIPSPWLALALALAFLFGAVVPHEVFAAGHRDSPVGAAIDRSASHPGDPAHVEQSTVEFQAACPLCVLQLQTRSVLHPPEAPLPPLLSSNDVLAAVAQIHSAPLPRLGPARAPPRLSSAL
jgi:hypothetical protein